MLILITYINIILQDVQGSCTSMTVWSSLAGQWSCNLCYLIKRIIVLKSNKTLERKQGTNKGREEGTNKGRREGRSFKRCTFIHNHSIFLLHKVHNMDLLLVEEGGLIP